MFYSQDILQKRGGKFSKIWLAATKMSKLSRREVASIHISRSCDEILEYVELRAEPGPSGKRPRFSLYLSSLLMYGVVRIHQKQGEYLLEDVSSALIRMRSLVKTGSAEDIDLRTECRNSGAWRQVQDLQDHLWVYCHHNLLLPHRDQLQHLHKRNQYPHLKESHFSQMRLPFNKTAVPD